MHFNNLSENKNTEQGAVATWSGVAKDLFGSRKETACKALILLQAKVFI
jgi:hypothetical protein